MSNLIVPRHLLSEPSTGRQVRITLPPMDPPKHLLEDFAVNPGTEEEFYRAVGRALNLSLNAPDTALREPTQAALKERIEACYRCVVTLRHDLKYPLRKCFDLLPGRFMEALRRDERPEDAVERIGQRKAWAKDGSERIEEVDKDAFLHDDHAPPPEPEPEVEAHDDEG